MKVCTAAKQIQLEIKSLIITSTLELWASWICTRVWTHCNYPGLWGVLYFSPHSSLLTCLMQPYYLVSAWGWIIYPSLVIHVGMYSAIAKPTHRNRSLLSLYYSQNTVVRRCSWTIILCKFHEWFSTMMMTKTYCSKTAQSTNIVFKLLSSCHHSAWPSQNPWHYL